MTDSVIENNKNPVCETEINYEENAVQITDASVIQDTVWERNENEENHSGSATGVISKDVSVCELEYDEKSIWETNVEENGKLVQETEDNNSQQKWERKKINDEYKSYMVSDPCPFDSTTFYLSHNDCNEITKITSRQNNTDGSYARRKHQNSNFGFLYFLLYSFLMDLKRYGLQCTCRTSLFLSRQQRKPI